MVKIKLNGINCTLSVNLYSLYNTSSELSITTPKLLERLSGLDLYAYSHMIYYSLEQHNPNVKYDDILDLGLEELLEIIEVVNVELAKSMPKSKEEEGNNSSSNNNDEDDEDWNYPYMEYIWSTILKSTTNYLYATPKNLFEQFDIYKKVNGLEEVKEEQPKKKQVVEKYIDEIF